MERSPLTPIQVDPSKLFIRLANSNNKRERSPGVKLGVWIKDY